LRQQSAGVREQSASLPAQSSGVAGAELSWPRVSRSDNASAYARKVLTNCFLSSRRLRRSRELPIAQVAETGAPAASDCDTDLRLTLLAALRQLPARSRAVVVLRYLEDHSIETVAQYLGTSPAAVKSLNARGMAQLRDVLGADQQSLRNP
jgi:RNA polymerase sigma factor (sigma-70 family)